MNPWSFALFLGIVLAILGAIHLFLYKQIVGGLGIQASGWLWGLRIALVYLAVSYPVARTLDAFAPNAVVLLAHWVASLWTGLMFHLLWILALFLFVRIVLLWTSLWTHLAASPEALHRGSVLVGITVAVVLCVVGMIGARQAAQIRRVTIPIAGLPDEMQGRRVAVFADLHAGALVDAAEVRRRVAEVQALEADLILVPGDIVDYPPKRMPEVGAALAGLKAPLGVYASTGNHEYIVGVEECLPFLREAGIVVLVNERVELPGGLVIAGIADASAPRFGGTVTPIADVVGLDAKTRPVILLSHTPANRAVEAGAAVGADLQLSGHTHGGQIWPFSLATDLVYRYHHGLYEVGEGYQLTTGGLGWWGPPMRLGVPPEIFLVELVAADQR